MRKHIGTVFAATLAAALVVAASTPSLAAAAGVTVHPGGPFTATSGNITFTESATGTLFTCTSSKATGVLKSGSGLSGTHIGRFNTYKITNCGHGSLPVFATPIMPWYLNVTGVNTTTGQVTGTISNIIAAMSAPGCTFTMAGTSAAAGGRTAMTYTNSTAKLDVTGMHSTLHAWDVKGCFGLVNNGDGMSFTVTYSVKPRQIFS